MKKIFILTVLMIISILSIAQVSLESLVKPGTKLTYGIEANGQKYDLIITIKVLVPALEFDWQMTDAANNNGTITHTATAMISANTMFNYFIPGAKKLDDNSISIWLSKNTYTGLMKEGKGTMMKMNTKEALKKMGTYTEEGNELKIIVNGEKDTIEEEIAKELNDEGAPAGDDTFFTFYKSAKMPVILRMKNVFYLSLKEIKKK